MKGLTPYSDTGITISFGKAGEMAFMGGMNSSDAGGGTQTKSRLEYLWVTLAAVTCPCHLPILVAVLSGTAFGAFLSNHFGLALLALTVLFFVFAAAAVQGWKRGGEMAGPDNAQRR